MLVLVDEIAVSNSRSRIDPCTHCGGLTTLLESVTHVVLVLALSLRRTGPMFFLSLLSCWLAQLWSGIFVGCFVTEGKAP